MSMQQTAFNASATTGQAFGQIAVMPGIIADGFSTGYDSVQSPDAQQIEAWKQAWLAKQKK